MTSSNITLFSYFRSSCSWRIRALLNFKGIDYEYKAVNLIKFEHKSPEFLQINPQGQVPALKIGEHVLTQSGSICEFIEEFFPQTKSVFPSDLYKRAVVREMCNLIGTYIQPLQNPFLGSKIAKKYAEGDEEKQAFIKADWPLGILTESFQVLEKMLAAHSGKYCLGDEITLADFYLVPQVYNAIRFKVDMDQFPNIKRVNDTLLQEECFMTSHPSRQPDCPEQLK